VGFGRNCDCSCGTLYVPMLLERGGGVAGLVSLKSSLIEFIPLCGIIKSIINSI